MPNYESLSPDLARRIQQEKENRTYVPMGFDDRKIRRRMTVGSDSATVWRPAFVHDIDKIMHCPYYNRYSDKTQVFSLIRNDDVTRRSLHVQLVSRIARTIGGALNLNLDLIEAIALGHDIGHPPFAHSGETYLDELYFLNAGRHFNHSVHSVRVLDRIFPLNVSLQVLDGIACHNGEIELPEYWPAERSSFEEFDRMIEGCYLDSGNVRKLGLSLSTLDFCFEGQVRGFVLEDIYKYVVEAVNLESLEGVVTADCSLRGNLSDILAMDIVGEVDGEDIAVLGPDGGNIFSAESLTLAFDRLNIEQQIYDFRAVKADGYATQICFNSDGGTNFDTLFYGEPELSVETSSDLIGDDIYDVRERVTVTTSEEVAPMSDMVLTIDTLRLTGGELRYVDNTMHRPFDYSLSNISIRSTNFELMGKNQISLRAQLPKQGSAMVVWEGSLADFYNQNILATLSNVDMQGLSTYIEHFTAFPVTSGNMTFRSQNVIANGELSGVNQLDTYNLAVGKKNRDIEVEYDVPMKLGIYVLTDRNKHIDVELPISGNIASPEFSLRKVIWRAIGNLLLKVAASPFEWMTDDKQDAFRHIDIDILSTGLDSEHYARIDTMAMTLKSDTALRVRLTPKVNYKRAVQRISELNLKMACYNASKDRDSAYLDMLDFVRIKDMKLSGSDIRAYADSVLINRGISPAGMSTQAKAKLLYGDLADQQLAQMLGHYNRIVSRYVEFQHKELADSAFVVQDVTLDDIKGYGGKDRYVVSLVIDGNEVEVTAEDEESAAEESETLFTDVEDAATEPEEQVAAIDSDGVSEAVSE